jgi:DNA-binding XRE family transcriptional regulator
MAQAKGSSVPRSESRSRAETPPDHPVRALPHGVDGLLSYESEFLTQLGGRVREMRGLHDMSRRELARRSGISERYIAQIEAGKGNVSITLLLRIALVFRAG